MSKKGDSPTYELVWRGRTHLGDEPGVYGDAQYAGLCAEWPLTLRKYDPKSTSDGSARVLLVAEDAGVLPPYPGHRVRVLRYVLDKQIDNAQSWRVLPADIEDRRLISDRLEFDIVLPGDFAVLYLSVRIEVDTSMHPGLYDDFVMTRLAVCSTTHFASLGFTFEASQRAQP